MAVATRVKSALGKYGVTAYARGKERPLGPYLAFMALYNSGLATLLLATRRSRRLPARLEVADIALLGVAAFKLGRLISRDVVTSPVRAPFSTYRGPGWVPAEASEDPRGQGLQYAIGEAVTCPYCLSQWSGAALLAGFLLAPRIARVFAGLMAGVAVADFLNLGYQIATATSDVAREAASE